MVLLCQCRFVLVKDVLSPERLETIRAGCAGTITEMVALDPQRLGNRGSHRYFCDPFQPYGWHSLERRVPPGAVAVC